MKKNDVILILAVIVYSFLFYLQLAGINFLIFSISLILMLLIKDISCLHKKTWILLAAGSIVSGVCVFMYGNMLSIIANIESLLLLSAFSYNPKSSVIAGFIHSLYSEVSSISFMIIDMIEKKPGQNKVSKGKIWTRIIITMVIISIILIMFFLYRKANPLFYNFTKEINLDFISFHWLWFTFIGFVVLYAFFYHRTFPAFERFDTFAPNNIDSNVIEEKHESRFRKIIGIEMESKAAIILLALLNFLILSVNIIDVNYLWLDHTLPADVSLSDSLHQAVGIIIFSIIIAIGVLLFIFRSDMNFYSKNKTLRILAVIWIIQNMLIVFSTLYRNHLYIQEFMLTYKRIGVYVYLTLTFSGLISALIKVVMAKSNWYLFRFNGWCFYLALMILPTVNWNRFITNYNLSHSVEPDLNYIFDLSYSNLPELLKYSQDHDLSKTMLNYPEILKFKDYADISSQISMKNLLDKKIYEFEKKNKKGDWRSLCLDRKRVKNELQTMHEAGQISSFDLSAYHLESAEHLRSFPKITQLDLSKNAISEFSSLENLNVLEELNLSENNISSIQSFPELKNLSTLNLSKNNLKDFSALTKLQDLNSLDISQNPIEDFSSVAQLKNLKSLYISDVDDSTLAKIQHALPETKIVRTNEKGENQLR